MIIAVIIFAIWNLGVDGDNEPSGASRACSLRLKLQIASTMEAIITKLKWIVHVLYNSMEYTFMTINV